MQHVQLAEMSRCFISTVKRFLSFCGSGKFLYAKKTNQPYILLMIYMYFCPLFFSSELLYFVVTFGILSSLMVEIILINIEMNDPVIGTKTR